MTSEHMQNVLAAIRKAGGPNVPKSIEPHDSLMLRLGFDSMKLALLSLALERELGFTIVLDGWIASHSNPYELTVGSLCRFVEESLRLDEPSVSP
jgi:acyl carrier protein